MKSSITCDMEGRILTMNSAAEKIFGYKKEELINKKRVSIFSPGEIVLQNVAGWLDEAVKKGEYMGETQFVKKDGTLINAKIRITPTFGDGKDKPQTGYCGITEVIDKKVTVPIKFSTKLIKALAITRMPFLSACIMPVLVGGAYSKIVLQNTNPLVFYLILFGVCLLHLASNVMNDYFDVKDGTDEANNNYFQQYSGGSRAIELGLISLKGTKQLGTLLYLLSSLVGVALYIITDQNINILILGLLGLLIGYFYTAPPFRIVARRGLGELFIALAFGPLITLGTVVAMSSSLPMFAFLYEPYLLPSLLIGLPCGLLTANILLINEFPDAESDATTGKNHLIVTFGKEKGIMIYAIILLLAIFSLFYMASSNIVENLKTFTSLSLNGFHVLGILLSFLGTSVWLKIRSNYKERSLVKYNIQTIMLSAFFGLMICLVIRYF